MGDCNDRRCKPDGATLAWSKLQNQFRATRKHCAQAARPLPILPCSLTDARKVLERCSVARPLDDCLRAHAGGISLAVAQRQLVSRA